MRNKASLLILTLVMTLGSSCTEKKDTGEIVATPNNFAKYASQKPFSPSAIITSNFLVYTDPAKTFFNLNGWDTQARADNFLGHIDTLYPIQQGGALPIPILAPSRIVGDTELASYQAVQSSVLSNNKWIVPALTGVENHSLLCQAFFNLSSTACSSYIFSGNISYLEISIFVHWILYVLHTYTDTGGLVKVDQSDIDTMTNLIGAYRTYVGADNVRFMISTGHNLTNPDPQIVEAASRTRFMTMLQNYPEAKILLDGEEMKSLPPTQVAGLQHTVYRVQPPPIGYKTGSGSQQNPIYTGYIEADLGLEKVDLRYYRFDDPDYGRERAEMSRHELLFPNP